MKAWLEKASSIGAVVAAAACPVCFPKLALLGAVFGLGALGAAVFGGLYLFGSEAVTYIGFAGLVAASATEFWQRLRRKPAKNPRCVHPSA